MQKQFDDNYFVQLDLNSMLKARSDYICKNKENVFSFINSHKLETILLMNNPTVIHKEAIPPSGCKNDYISYRRYWWLNSGNGTWEKRDGHTNPATQTNLTDRKRLEQFACAVSNLSEAYYLSKNETYAAKAIEMIRMWFIIPETRMTPHLEYSQMVPGDSRGHKTGVLDGRFFSTRIIDSILLLKNSPNFTASDLFEIELWFSDFLQWMLFSSTGCSARGQKNNHLSWYLFQICCICLYLKDIKLISKMLSKIHQCIDLQIDKNGAQHLELVRASPFHYCCFNLDALTRLAIVLEKAGFSIWQYKSASGGSLYQALQYLEHLIKNRETHSIAINSTNIEYFETLLHRYKRRCLPRFSNQSGEE